MNNEIHRLTFTGIPNVIDGKNADRWQELKKYSILRRVKLDYFPWI